jgi:hypothetical protein
MEKTAMNRARFSSIVHQTSQRTCSHCSRDNLRELDYQTPSKRHPLLADPADAAAAKLKAMITLTTAAVRAGKTEEWPGDVRRDALSRRHDSG